MYTQTMLKLYERSLPHYKKVIFLLLAGCLIALSYVVLTSRNKPRESNYIPDFTLDMRNGSKVSLNGGSLHSCTPTKNVFFLKVPKTGSTTMFGILNRLAINHGLRVVTYDKGPSSFNKRDQHQLIKNIIPDFTVGKSEMFNVLIDHSYFVKKDVEAILKPPISYIAMLREPLSQVRSHHFYSGRGKESSNGKTHYYDPLTKNTDKLKEVTDNPIAKRFGARPRFGIDDADFLPFVNDLDKTFLVGLTEYYAESLILFKRRLCWQLEDVIHVPIRKGRYHSKVTFDPKQDETLRQTHCSKNAVDCELYNHFNKSFWRQVEQEGQDFKQEVEHFKNVIRNVSNFCSTNFACAGNRRKRSPPLNIAKSYWNPKLWFTVNDCARMHMAEPTVANYHYYTQNMEDCFKLNRSESKGCAVKPRPFGPRTCDGLCQHAPNKTRMLDDLLNTKCCVCLE